MSNPHKFPKQPLAVQHDKISHKIFNHAVMAAVFKKNEDVDFTPYKIR